jgi:hypothetical protein
VPVARLLVGRLLMRHGLVQHEVERGSEVWRPDPRFGYPADPSDIFQVLARLQRTVRPLSLTHRIRCRAFADTIRFRLSAARQVYFHIAAIQL